MIQLENLSKNYGNKRIYSQVNLVFEANKSYALIGPSGSGKTTLLNAIARLEKPNNGKVLLNNQDIWAMKERD
ncbi:SRP54-type protein, GTPase domain protein [Streptococcus sp. oral taxon 056 str. F0418]|nr:SRP54-type protein, GTPase domain protein [Streptococcus sp. oral taxon 056 str. F0418]